MSNFVNLVKLRIKIRAYFWKIKKYKKPHVCHDFIKVGYEKSCSTNNLTLYQRNIQIVFHAPILTNSFEGQFAQMAKVLKGSKYALGDCERTTANLRSSGNGGFCKKRYLTSRKFTACISKINCKSGFPRTYMEV